MGVGDLLDGRRAVRVRTRAERAEAARLMGEGRLARVLPATYVRAADAPRPEALAHAVCAYDGRAVLTGASAAALHLRPQRWPPVITFASPRQWTLTRPWLVATRTEIDAARVRRRPLPHVEPAVAALQVATTEGPRIIDSALRRGTFTATHLEAALAALAGTPGNAERRRLVRASLAHPWSEGERELHALLAGARLRGWRGNHRVVAMGGHYVLDVAFPAERVAVELDSWTHHSSPEAFEDDRARHDDLVAAGWAVLRVTPRMVDQRPRFVVERVRRTLATRTGGTSRDR